MNRRNSKATAERGAVAKPRYFKHKNSKYDNSIMSSPSQSRPVLTAFLQDFRLEVLSLPFDLHASLMLDCADFLLDNADQVKKGGATHDG